jgi:hypothetical protein
MNAKFLKGLLITIIGTFFSLYNEPKFIWTVAIITLVGTALTYFGKNVITILQSTSVQGEFSWKNAVSALLIGIGSAITEAVATIAGTGVIQWPLLLKVVIGVVSTYFVSTIYEGGTPTSNPVK